MRYLIALLLILFSTSVFADTWYVRTDGGTITECDGHTNVAYPGSGTNQACAVNHLFELFPPGGTVVISGGDTVIIGSGSYRMGHTAGVYDGGDCNSEWGYDCVAPQIPSGIDANNPTRILGVGWDTESGDKPELYGVERASHILDIGDSDYVEIQWLELTDHEDCTYNAQGETTDSKCNRSSYPRGDHADNGLVGGNDSHDVLLKNLNIHGFSLAGVKAAGITDWTVENVRIANNSFVGWDGDYGSSPSNSGDIIFKNVEILFSGCAETYPGGQPHNCYSQTQGGYGDGLGTALTGGNWLFDGVDISYNVSDGLDLLYMDGTGTITIKNSKFESNTGNQVKVADDVHLENNIIIGNCEYFATTHPGLTIDSSIPFDSCRAGGDTIAYMIKTLGQELTLVNNTILSRSTVMIMAKGDNCDGTEKFVARNNIFYGDRSYLKYIYDGSTVRPDLFYQAGSDGNGSGSCGFSTPATAITMDNKYNIVYQTKDGVNDCSDATTICGDPLFNDLDFSDTDPWDTSLSASSPAIDKSELDVGDTVYGSVVVPSTDYLSAIRPADGTIDWGAYEYDGVLNSTCYPDLDNDLYPGSGSESVTTCTANWYESSHFVSMVSDCNDTDALINPGLGNCGLQIGGNSSFKIGGNSQIMFR